MTLIAKSAAALFCAALTLPLATPAVAGEAPTGFVVESEAAMQLWQKKTTAQLNRNLRSTPMPAATSLKSSIVQVRFTLDERGKADDIEVVGGNGNWTAERTARHAVRRLNTLADAPISNPQGATFLANIIFANDLEQHKRLAAELVASDNPRFALVTPDENTVLLGG